MFQEKLIHIYFFHLQILCIDVSTIEHEDLTFLTSPTNMAINNSSSSSFSHLIFYNICIQNYIQYYCIFFYVLYSNVFPLAATPIYEWEILWFMPLELGVVNFFFLALLDQARTGCVCHGILIQERLGMVWPEGLDSRHWRRPDMLMFIQIFCE